MSQVCASGDEQFSERGMGIEIIITRLIAGNEIGEIELVENYLARIAEECEMNDDACQQKTKNIFHAERVGFEPTMSFTPCRVSNAVPSTTQPPLHNSELITFCHFYKKLLYSNGTFVHSPGPIV